jgi:hypothetical protein
MCTFALVLPFKVAMHFIGKLRKVPLRSQGGPFFIRQNTATSVKTAVPLKPDLLISYDLLRLKCNLACAPIRSKHVKIRMKHASGILQIGSNCELYTYFIE